MYFSIDTYWPSDNYQSVILSKAPQCFKIGKKKAKLFHKYGKVYSAYKHIIPIILKFKFPVAMFYRWIFAG